MKVKENMIVDVTRVFLLAAMAILSLSCGKSKPSAESVESTQLQRVEGPSVDVMTIVRSASGERRLWDMSLCRQVTYVSGRTLQYVKGELVDSGRFHIWHGPGIKYRAIDSLSQVVWEAGANGDSLWRLDGCCIALMTDGRDSLRLRQHLCLIQSGVLDTTDFKVEDGGLYKDTRACYRLLIHTDRTTRKQYRQYYNTRTGYLEREVSPLGDAGDSVLMIYSDFLEIDGFLIASRVSTWLPTFDVLFISLLDKLQTGVEVVRATCRHRARAEKEE
jgi:hypothetical protein